jgi:hypothetical protein
MPELEIHHETEHGADGTGRTVGIVAAILAVALAIVSIVSHRTHTAAIMHKSTANDDWSHYQATRVKYHNLELGQNLLAVFGAKGAAADAMRTDYDAQMLKYEKQGKDIQHDAESADGAAEASEHQALRFDIGEGLLEIGLVLTSLYFISRRAMFPVMGVVAGLAGIAIAITGTMV